MRFQRGKIEPQHFIPLRKDNFMKNFALPEYNTPVERFVGINSVEEATNLSRAIRTHGKLVAVDTETYYSEETGGVCKVIGGSKNNKPFCLTLTVPDGDDYKSFFVPEELIPACRDWLRDEEITKIFHNYKFDAHMLKNMGITVGGYIWDTMVMIHLIDEEHECRTPEGKYKRSKALKDLAYHYLGDDGHMYEDLVSEVRSVLSKNIGVAKSHISYKDVYEASPLIMKDYACSDTEFTFKIFRILYNELLRQNLLIAYETDMHATEAVLEMERTGMAVDMNYYDELGDKLTRQIGEIDAGIRRMGIPDSLNVRSQEDLVKMFGKLGQAWRWYTAKGSYNTSSSVLEYLETSTNPNVAKLAGLVSERREAEKLRDTFIAQIKEFCDVDGRIHPDFNICPREEKNNNTAGGTVTGRLSSSNPNLQNIPKDDKRIREGMVPSPGFFFAELDYSQQEYRLLGAYARDRNFSQIIHDGKDIHAGTAEMMLGISHEEAMLKKNRDVGKRINFA